MLKRIVPILSAFTLLILQQVLAADWLQVNEYISVDADAITINRYNSNLQIYQVRFHPSKSDKFAIIHEIVDCGLGLTKQMEIVAANYAEAVVYRKTLGDKSDFVILSSYGSVVVEFVCQ